MEEVINNDKWPQILEFTIKHWPVENIALNRQTRLLEDLGIKGDDADEFIYAFAKAFNVDITNIDLSNYFTGNDFDFITPILKVFKRKPIKERMPLTLGDLEESISIGKLDDDIIMKKHLR